MRTAKGPRQKVLVNLGRIDHQKGKKMLELLTLSLVEILDRLHILNVAKDIEGKESKKHLLLSTPHKGDNPMIYPVILV